MQLGTEAALKASANLSAIALLSHSPSMTDRVVFLPNLDLMHVAVLHCRQLLVIVIRQMAAPNVHAMHT